VEGGKGRMTDWGIRVPALARWPGRLPAGRVTEAMCDMTDLLPTFCELAGVTPPADGDGRSFAALLRGRLDAGAGRDWIFAEAQDRGCVRSRQWKLTSRGQLFRVGDDPFAERLIRPEEETPETRAARRRWQRRLDAIMGR
jgi:arylsulfatase A-like enzyme